MKALKETYILQQTKDIPDDLSELIDEVSDFHTYDDVKKWNVNWDSENNEFLKEIGLPVSAPTMIDFISPAQDEGEYIHIGHNNYGDKIIILKNNGNVVFINHDLNDRIEYMNKDVISLFKSICTFVDMMKGSNNYIERINEFDSDAYTEGKWWFVEYLGYKERKNNL